MNNTQDIKDIVQRFEASVAPGDDAGAQAFFEAEFANFSEELKQAVLYEALTSAAERAGGILGAVNDMQEETRGS